MCIFGTQIIDSVVTKDVVPAFKTAEVVQNTSSILR